MAVLQHFKKLKSATCYTFIMQKLFIRFKVVALEKSVWSSLTGKFEDKDPLISNLFLFVPSALFLFTDAYIYSIPAFECGVTDTR